MPYQCQRSLALISVSDSSCDIQLLHNCCSLGYTTIPRMHTQYRARPLLADPQTARNWRRGTPLEHLHAGQDPCIV